MCGGTIWKFLLRVSARNPLLPAEPLASTFCRVLLHPAFSLPGAQICRSLPEASTLVAALVARWLCARPSPEGWVPVAAQAGPAEAGVGRLGLGEDGRGEPRRKQLGRQGPSLRPVGRCHLQVSQPGASSAPRPLSDPEVLLGFELGCRRGH